MVVVCVCVCVCVCLSLSPLSRSLCARMCVWWWVLVFCGTSTAIKPSPLSAGNARLTHVLQHTAPQPVVSMQGTRKEDTKGCPMRVPQWTARKSRCWVCGASKMLPLRAPLRTPPCVLQHRVTISNKPHTGTHSLAYRPPTAKFTRQHGGTSLGHRTTSGNPSSNPATMQPTAGFVLLVRPSLSRTPCAAVVSPFWCKRAVLQVSTTFAFSHVHTGVHNEVGGRMVRNGGE